MSPRLDRIVLRFALAVLPLPILWFVAIEPFQTLQRLVPVEATLHEAYTKRVYSRTGRVHSNWLAARLHVSYEYDGTRLNRFAELQVGGERPMSEDDVAAGVRALQPLVGKTLTVWVDLRHPKEAYVHRRMLALRAWAWIAALVLFWIVLFRWRRLFVPDPRQPGTGELFDTIEQSWDRRGRRGSPWR